MTFATSRYRWGAGLLGRTARRYGLATRIFGPSDAVVVELAQRFPEIMSAQRGAGYWLWKPYIIREAMRNLREGDTLLYTDAAMVFVADPEPLLSLANEHPIALFEHVPVAAQSEWTKRDCFVMLDADTPAMWETPQLWAGCQLYRVGSEARIFVDELCAAMSNAQTLTDAPNVHGLPDLPGFKVHRHDQSILTILARKAGLPFFPDPSQWGLRAPRGEQPVGADGIVRPAAPYGQVLHVHRKKNNVLPFWYLRHLLRRLVRRESAGGPGW